MALSKMLMDILFCSALLQQLLALLLLHLSEVTSHER